jgi:hypothetical protein
MPLSRRALLAVLAALVATPAGAANKNVEVFAKLSPISLEYWDQAGLFHVVNMDLTVVFLGEGKIDKLVVDKIQQALSAMTWEEFSKGNPVATIKAIALDIVRKQKSSEQALDVLVIKLMMR